MRARARAIFLNYLNARERGVRSLPAFASVIIFRGSSRGKSRFFLGFAYDYEAYTRGWESEIAR